jgi:hypothetical protein
MANKKGGKGGKGGGGKPKPGSNAKPKQQVRLSESCAVARPLVLRPPLSLAIT